MSVPFYFSQKHYPLSNILITAAGNLEHDKLVELVAATFPSEKVTNDYIDSNGRTPAPQFIKIETQKPIEQIHFCFGTQSFQRNHPDRFAISLLSVILGGGMSSRLFELHNRKSKR